MASALDVLARDKLSLNNNWDPTKTYEEDIVTTTSTNRINFDVMECVNAGNQELFVVPDSKSNFYAHAIIVGPERTPYDGGFFYFFIKFPANYPLAPPRVKLMNTDHNSVRFNPNFFKNGMVGLGILGTCVQGPVWRPLNTLYNVLISIQTLMNADPFDNSLGLTGYRETEEDQPSKYIDYIRHETIRVAVINFMKKDNTDLSDMPETMREKVDGIFTRKIHFYFRVIMENIHLDTVHMYDPFNYCVNGQRFDYKSLKRQMCDLTKVYQTNADVIRHTFELFNVEAGELDDFVEKFENSDLSEPEPDSNSN